MTLLATILIASVGLLFIPGLIGSNTANQQVKPFGRFALFAAMFNVMGVTVAAVLQLGQGLQITRLDWLGLWQPALYHDRFSSVILLLIAFLGLVVMRYAMRYLDGDLQQGRFIRWLCLTLASVQLFVISGNLLLTTLAWMACSYGLHHLLMHYPDRPGASQGAWHKFIVSRIGDVFLVTGLVLTWTAFGTWDYGSIFQQAQSATSANAPAPILTLAIGLCYVIGAMTKSAQLPFHGWLPKTLQTPTPVSALMHAGIINAGGFLVIRLSPMLQTTPIALNLLAIVGVATAIMACLIMMTQSSIKHVLAYSTIAQMGFMMLECGLGAFNLAMVHLVAHSVYKAYAFLNCGSVVDEATQSCYIQPPVKHWQTTLCTQLAAVLLAIMVSLVSWISLAASGHLNIAECVLCLILTLAIIQILHEAMATGSFKILGKAALASVFLATAYALVTLGSLTLIPDVQLIHAGSWAWSNLLVAALVAMAFVALTGFDLWRKTHPDKPLAQKLYVHASNGFYLDMSRK
ncbi:MAG: hypothetical protein CMJ19_08880 [Phycisphaeraceae bacterium]|nr:hypothetical protein [Phycisphaeraceae bacterium]